MDFFTKKSHSPVDSGLHTGKSDNKLYTIQPNERLYAEQLLGKDYLAELLGWFDDLLGSEADFVVLTTKRGFISALYAERISGRLMPDMDQKRFLTDAAFLNMASYFAEFYVENGRFPTIYLVDDLLLHGRNLMHILHQMEEAIVEEFRVKSVGFDENEIITAFSQGVTICVYAGAKRGNVLDLRYEQRVKARMSLSRAKIHELSGLISSMISHGGIANVCYVPAMRLSKEDMSRIQGRGDFHRSEYQGHTAYTQSEVYGEGDAIRFISTLRVGETFEQAGLAVPYVLMPDTQDEQGSQLLEEKILTSLEESVKKQFIRYRNGTDRRSINELIVMFFSSAVLADFQRKIGKPVGVSDDEVRKIAREFYHDSLQETEEFIQMYIDAAMQQDIDELCEFLGEVYGTDYLGIATEASEIGSSGEELETEVENLFYSMAYTDEYYAGMRSTREQRRIPFSDVFSYLLTNKSISRSRIPELVEILLQMMDTGVVSVSAFPDRGRKVEGYNQFIKAGEQAMIIPVLRIYPYLFMISALYIACQHNGYDFRESIKRCFDGFRQNGCDYVRDSDKAMVLQFVDDVESYGQDVRDWLGNYESKLQLSRSELDRLRQIQIELSRDCFDYFYY